MRLIKNQAQVEATKVEALEAQLDSFVEGIRRTRLALDIALDSNELSEGTRKRISTSLMGGLPSIEWTEHPQGAVTASIDDGWGCFIFLTKSTKKYAWSIVKQNHQFVGETATLEEAKREALRTVQAASVGLK